MKWPVEAIGVVAQVNPRLAAADRPDLDERVSFVPMAAVSGETLSIEAQAERLFSEVAKGYTPFKRGDVLVAKITPCFENGKMAMADNLAHELGFGTTEFHVFRPSERITGSYLFNLLRAPYVRKAGAMRMKGAAGQRRVPADFFAALQIPLPPLDEQKRIAGILDAVDALRAKRREALGQLDTLLQSTFLDMFGDPVSNSMGWERKPLGEVIRVRSGDGLVSKDMVSDGRYPVYGGNGISGYHDSFMFEEPRIVLGRVGVYCGAVHLTRPRAWVTDNALYVHTFIQPVDTIYVVAALKMANLNQYAGRSAQPLISANRIYPVEILFPPLDLQHRFAAIVASVEQQRARQRAHLAELDTLFASLQFRAFRGDL